MTDQAGENLIWASHLIQGLAAGGAVHAVISPGSRSTPLALACLLAAKGAILVIPFLLKHLVDGKSSKVIVEYRDAEMRPRISIKDDHLSIKIVECSEAKITMFLNKRLTGRTI